MGGLVGGSPVTVSSRWFFDELIFVLPLRTLNQALLLTRWSGATNQQHLEGLSSMISGLDWTLSGVSPPRPSPPLPSPPDDET